MRIPLRPAWVRGFSVAAALVAVSASAPVQATGGSLKVNGTSKFGRADCDGTSVTFTWDLTSASPAYPAGTNLVVRAATATACDANSDRADYKVTNVATGTSDAIPLSNFLFGTKTCATSTTTAAKPGSAYFCVGYYTGTTTTGALSEVESVLMQYAMGIPSAPANVSVSSGDGLLRVTFGAGGITDANGHYEIYVVEDPSPADGGAGDLDAGSDAGAAADAGAADAGAADAGADAGTADGGTIVDPFAGLDPVAKPTSAGTTLIEKTSTGAVLVNGRHYLVRLRFTDSYKNDSDFTATYGGTPTPIDDFYAYYQKANGSAKGGCGGAGAGWVAGLLLLGWLAARRRRGGSSARTTAPLLLLALLGLASAAGAEGVSSSAVAAVAASPAAAAHAPAAIEPSPAPAEPSAPPSPVLAPVRSELERKPLRAGRPPRTTLFALKIDRYDPKIDSQAGLTKRDGSPGGQPYHDIFGDRIPVRVQLEAEWQALHPRWFGSLLVGATGGFWQNIGKGRYATDFTDSAGVKHSAGDRSDDTALLNIWPLGLIATWRLDALADQYRWFPLIPYAQAGLTAALWASYNGAGKVTTNDKGTGSGWTFGYTTALGVALALDAIDPGLSNEAYVDLGLQRTSFFAEYGWTRLDSFQSGSALILTDRSWRFGMSMEF